MGAIEKYKADPQIIVCGINYDNGHKFRSTAILEFGVPYKMPPEISKNYQNSDQKKEVVSIFLEKLSNLL